MSIGYKDFFPGLLHSGLLSNEYEKLPATVARANEWVAKAGVGVINIETVVLPNVQQTGHASENAHRTGGNLSSYWFQVVRVWYETPAG